MTNKQSLASKSWFKYVYRIGIGVKGFDGLVELLAGIGLLLSPGLVHKLLSIIADAANDHHGRASEYITTYVARLDGDLAKSGLTFLIIFLMSHGLVKLVLVYCLLREIVWAYPYALFILVGFLIYQLYVLVLDPTSIGMWLFTILDIIIIYLVWGEWRELVRKK